MRNIFNRLWSLRPDGIESMIDYAKFLGIPREQLTRWKKGHYVPRVQTIEAIAKKLNCDPAWLMFEPSDRDRRPTAKSKKGFTFLGVEVEAQDDKS